MTEPAVLTIGHSNHAIEKFLALLQAHKVASVVDVRSTPYSRRQPQFNRENLRPALEECGIKYECRGQELGARSDDPSCYENGRVRYNRIAGTPLFQSGIACVAQEARERRVALLCAEKEPLDCHRTLLVARALEEQGVAMAHIHADGRLETQAGAMTRLLKKYNMAEPDLFLAWEQMIEQACVLREEQIAYVVPTAPAAREEHAV